MVRESTLDIGDRVLIRNVGLKSKHKLADRWDKHSYVVTKKPFGNIPVFKVQKESADEEVKLLHINMLLSFSCIPRRSCPPTEIYRVEVKENLRKWHRYLNLGMMKAQILTPVVLSLFFLEIDFRNKELPQIT